MVTDVLRPVSILRSVTDTLPVNANGALLVTKQAPPVLQVAN